MLTAFCLHSEVVEITLYKLIISSYFLYSAGLAQQCLHNYLNCLLIVCIVTTLFCVTHKISSTIKLVRNPIVEPLIKIKIACN